MLQPFPQVVDLLECVSWGSKRSRLWLVKVTHTTSYPCMLYVNTPLHSVAALTICITGG